MQAQRAVLARWPGEFVRILEMMTGCTVRLGGRAESSPPTLWWDNRLMTDPPVRLRAGASKDCWFGLGSAVLKAAGVESEDEDEVRHTWLEVLGQAASATASAAAPGGGYEVLPGDEAGMSDPQTEVVTFQFGFQTYSVELVAESEGCRAGVRPAAAAPTRAMDALLDVHLPVSISFGHARMPLKDVLKLAAGAVVELNRQPEDPVEVIVNDCVVARGEVVVVDGNYAVRIRSIVGRQDRLGLGTSSRDMGRSRA